MHEFKLLETCLYTDTIYLLNYHLQRLYNSAKYFGFKFHPETIAKSLMKNFLPNSCVRLTLDKDGNLEILNKSMQNMPLFTQNNKAKVFIDQDNIDINLKQFFLHKTTYRQHYDIHINKFKYNANIIEDFTDILLCNNGYITEGTRGNIAILDDNNNWYTPNLSNILLNGTLRQYLLYYKNLQCKNITLEEVFTAKKVIWFNSLRGIWECDVNLG